MAASKPNTSNNLTALVRNTTGKGASRQARRDGQVPAVLYGHGGDTPAPTRFWCSMSTAKSS
jgi:large subunit ribosomal protein L25